MTRIRMEHILHKTKRDILKINPHAEVNLYGKSIMNENRVLYLAKKSISNADLSHQRCDHPES